MLCRRVFREEVRLENSFLVFPKGVKTITGSSLVDVYLCKDRMNVTDLIFKEIRDYFDGKSDNFKFILTGTPGIGK